MSDDYIVLGVIGRDVTPAGSTLGDRFALYEHRLRSLRVGMGIWILLSKVLKQFDRTKFRLASNITRKFLKNLGSLVPRLSTVPDVIKQDIQEDFFQDIQKCIVISVHNLQK